jgi:hypothetical protein
MVATMRRYLVQLGESLKPRSIDAAEAVLRQFAGRVTEADAGCRSVAAIDRGHVEDYLAWLRARPGQQPNSTVLAGTHRPSGRTGGQILRAGHRLGLRGRSTAEPDQPTRRPTGTPGPGSRKEALRRPRADHAGQAPARRWLERGS